MCANVGLSQETGKEAMGSMAGGKARLGRLSNFRRAHGSGLTPAPGEGFAQTGAQGQC